MTTSKTLFGLLVAVVAAAVGVVAFGAAQASASSAPVVVAYEKTCDASGHCTGTVGSVTIDMQLTGFRPTGKAAQVTVTELVTVGGVSFTAELSGTMSPAGFIVLNGTVTGGPLAGAQVHQRSNLTGVDGSTTSWAGELRIAPASA